MIFWIVFSSVILILIDIYLFLAFPAINENPEIEKLGRYVAHRGLHSIKEGTPENSLAAFYEAITHGYAIELDLHITADGEIVVFHDDNLKRMCGVDGKLAEMTLEELKRLRLADTDERIPTFKEVLALVDGAVPLLIELKGQPKTYTELCRKIDRILADYKGVYFMQSFFSPAIKWYKDNRPEVCRGQLSENFFKKKPKKNKLVHRMLALLMFNFMSRPQFLSYRYMDAKFLPCRLVVALGAYPIGWTFKSQEAIDQNRDKFKVFIFEGFIPEE